MTTMTSLLPAFMPQQQPVALTCEINSSKILKNNLEKEVHIYATNWLGRKKCLGITPLDSSNCFKFNYITPTQVFKTYNISLEIFEKNRPFASQGLHGYCEIKPLGKATIQLDNQPEQNLTITDEQIKNLTHINKPRSQGNLSINYVMRLVQAVGPEVLKSAMVKLFYPWMTVEKIQKLYDTFGPQYPYNEPTIQNLTNELLNTICAVDFEKNGDQISWTANWDGYQFDRENSLPNVSIKARKEQDNLIIESIKIKFRGQEEQTIDPEKSSPEEVKWAIFIARSIFALKGEAEIHLAEGHLLPGIFGESFLTSVSKQNPLYDVTARYLENLEFINWLGGHGIIFGKGSVIEVSALTEHSVAEVVIKYMKKKADFINYQPIEPITSNHYRASVGKLHYNILLNFFTDYIDKHWDQIALYKHEIFNWSESMHKKLSSIPKIMSSQDHFSKEMEGKRLALCLASLVNQTTFLHWSCHARQELLTHLELASLCSLNNARSPDGSPIKFGNTPKDVANMQLKLSRALLNFKSHRFVDYANQELLERIDRVRSSYWPYPLQEIFVSTEI